MYEHKATDLLTATQVHAFEGHAGTQDMCLVAVSLKLEKPLLLWAT
jgi:hypothetical protein